MSGVFSQTLRRAGLVLTGIILLLQTLLPVTAFANGNNGTDHPACQGRVEINVNAPTWTVSAQYNNWQIWSKAGNNPHTNHGYLSSGTTINSGIPDGSGHGFKDISHVDACPPPPGSIKVVKDAQPNSTDDFDFTIKKGQSTVSSFELEDDGNEYDGQPNNFKKDGLSSGTYVVTEDPDETGWVLSDIACTGTNNVTKDVANSKVTIVLAGENVVCTFINKTVGKITVNKKVDADGNGVYEGSNGTANTLGFDWGLDSETPARDMGTSAVNVPTGSHTITEDSASGYVFTGWYYTQEEDNQGQHQVNCTNPQGTTLPVQFNLSKNEHKQITLCNQYRKGTIKLIKKVVNNDGGTAVVSDFSLSIGGNNVTSGQVVSLSPGSYAINEVGLPGYEFVSITGAGCPAQLGGNVNLAANQNIVCTITNDDIAPTLTLKKVVVNDDGGTNQADEWVLKAQEGANAPVINTTGTGSPVASTGAVDVVAGVTYTLSESGPSGYTASEWVCTSDGGPAFSHPNGLKNEVRMSLGANVTCVITNDDIAPTVTVVKETDQATDLKFQFVTTNGSFGLGDGWSVTADELKAGEEFEALEEETAGWKLSLVSCSGTDISNWTEIQEGNNPRGIRVTPEAGENVVCVFRNTKLGSIGGFKQNDANGNGVSDAGEEKLSGWTIRLYGECEPVLYRSTALLDNLVDNPCTELIDETVTDVNGNYEFTSLADGTYKVCEVQQNGWTRTFPANSDCHEIVIEGGNDETAIFLNKAKDPGQVLGTSTPEVLANTGTPMLQGLIVGLSIIGAASGITYFSRRKQAASL